MNLRVVSRAIIYDSNAKKLLLARNNGADFWYAPGGGWEHEKENIQEAVIREVKEECGITVTVQQLLYVQEFHPSDDAVFLEMFWLCSPAEKSAKSSAHSDTDPEGEVAEIRWYTQTELEPLTVFPKRLKGSFWDRVESITKTQDPFIGVM